MNLDVIGIGAILHDFVFKYRPGRDEIKGSHLDQGPEYLDGDDQDIAQRIVRRFHRDSRVTVQVGGSAYLAIKAISSMGRGLKTGYVGIHGTPGAVEQEVCPGFPAVDEFDHLDDRIWFFRSTAGPGRDIILTRRGARVEIRVAQGANSELVTRIREQIQNSGDADAFAKYLANARWIHVTSFTRFDDFAFMMEQVRRAKEINFLLRCSVDPGYEYVQKHASRLHEILRTSDVLFLSATEAQHLVGGSDVRGRTRVERLSEFGSSTRILVVKGKTQHLLVHQVGGRPMSRTYWHPRLSRARIRNDIGAGDVFAGGFIGGLLMEELVAHQPAAVRLGATLAAERLKSHDFPTAKLRLATEEFLRKGHRDERMNPRQRASVIWERYGPVLLAFIVGVLSSAAASALLAR